MRGQLYDWLSWRPRARAVSLSLWAAMAASILMVFDTVGLFLGILRSEIVRVPFVDGLGVSWMSAGVGVGLWVTGLCLLAFPRSRGRWGWIAAVGLVWCAFLDQQTFASSILYVLAISLAMHWWHADLVRRAHPAASAPLRVVQFLVTVVFFWTAIAKINPRFLSGGVLSVSFLGPVPAPSLLTEMGTLRALAVATIVFEALLSVGVWLRQLRRPLVIGAVCFHILIVLFFAPTLALVAFSLAMFSGYALFWGEPWGEPSSPPGARP